MSAQDRPETRVSPEANDHLPDAEFAALRACEAYSAAYAAWKEAPHARHAAGRDAAERNLHLAALRAYPPEDRGAERAP